MEEVKKVWGKELIVINCDKYCGKLLYLDQGAESSCHYHKKKQETFYCLEGQVALTIEGKNYMLNPYSRPKTIKPGVKHSFTGLAASTIIEFSSQHDDRDVFRLSESKAGKKPPIDCRKFDDCTKIVMVLDKDLLDFQYREAIEEMCHKCAEREPL